jgi:hypothetical protein
LSPLLLVDPFVRRTVPAELLRLWDKLAIRAPELARLDAYYAGQQPLAFLAPEVAEQVGGRLATLVINWPRVIADSVTRRSLVEGFRVGSGGGTDDELWRIWQANDLDEWAPLAHTDSLVHGCSYLSVWANDEDPDTPRITVESAHQMAVEFTPGTRRVSAALKAYYDEDEVRAILMGPDLVRKYRGDRDAAPEAWTIEEQFANPLGAVPVVPLPNRARVLNLDGESELADVLPLADAINKLATDMMVTSEFHASPRRYATGITLPRGAGQDERLREEARAYWDQATKGKTWLAGSGVDFGQFPEASLQGFVAGIHLLTAALAAIGGLPPDDLGLNTTNPASAEARRAAETTLILRAREKHRPWGGGHERAMRMAVALREGMRLTDLPVDLRRMETVWADPATPAVAQTFDAAVKGVDSGVFDVEQAREFVGLTPVQREAIRERARAVAAEAAARAAAAEAATSDVRARIELARELQRTDGLTQNAALAAVGLLQAAAQNAASTPEGA